MAVSRSDWSCFRKDTVTLRTATYWMMVFQTTVYSQLCVCRVFCLFLFIYLYDITVAICSYPAVLRRQQGLIH